MPLTKLIYGAGRIPRASEFSLGEIIVNVDDSKVYSKNKNNIVFQIGGSGTTSTINTGSFYIGSSLSGNDLIFDQGDGTTETVDLTPIINAAGDDDWHIDTGVKLTSSLSIEIEGYISASRYLVLKGEDNTTGVAGGLLYSSSNDFYLGFS